MNAQEVRETLPPGWDFWAEEARETRRRRFRLAMAFLLVLGGLAVGFGWEQIRLFFEPRPQRVWIVAAPAGDAVARAGRLELPFAARFDLHAVVEARTWYGVTRFFSEVPVALLPSGKRVTTERWSDGIRRTRLRWHSLEPRSPYVEVGAPSDLDRVAWGATFRPEFGSGWSVREIVVDPRSVWVEEGKGIRPIGAGTARFAVRFEAFEGRDRVTPTLRLDSPGFSPPDSDLFGEPPWVEVRALRAEPLRDLSGKVGLPQVALRFPLSPEVVQRIARFEQHGWLVEAGLELERLQQRIGPVSWSSVDRLPLPGIAEGDWVRFSGERVAIVWADRPPSNQLEGQDLVWIWSRGGRLLSFGKAVEELGPPVAWLSLRTGVVASKRGLRQSWDRPGTRS
jgi:hypothetical protein